MISLEVALTASVIVKKYASTNTFSFPSSYISLRIEHSWIARHDFILDIFEHAAKDLAREKEDFMRTGVACGTVLTLLACGAFVGCSNTHKQYPDVSAQVRNALDQAGLKDVSVHQDRDKGVVTLSGTTTSDSDRGQAESIAKSIASAEVVSDQIAVRPTGEESTAKTVDSDIDKGIEKNFDAVLVKHKLNHTVKYDVRNGVVTLSGKVHSEVQRNDVQKLASNVPNVRQVVNELEVPGHKGAPAKTSSSD